MRAVSDGVLRVVNPATLEPVATVRTISIPFTQVAAAVSPAMRWW